jgi:hypothetical protein
MSTDERNAMDRPTYSQRHPAMATARNIVNQILDEACTDIATRQRINDDCDQFVAWMLERYAASKDVAGGPPPAPYASWDDYWADWLEPPGDGGVTP